MKNLKTIHASNYSLTSDGDLYSLRVNRFMVGWESNGYRKYSITFDDGNHKEVFAHRLVAFVFLEKQECHTEVNHIDGDKTNNSVSNLEWCTPQQNTQHAYDIGLNTGKKPSKNVPTLKGVYEDTSSFTEEDVHRVCRLIQEGYRDVDISRMTNLGRRNINYLRHKRVDYWYRITTQYSYSFKKEDRMSPEVALRVCTLLSQGMGVCQTARELSLNRKQVGNIKNRKSFREISSAYKWD